MNNSGQVVGVVYMIYFDSGSGYQIASKRVFLGTAAGVSTLITLPAGATRSSVVSQSINDLGMIVGQSDAGGWIWDTPAGTRLLNTLVPFGWTVTNAISVSDNGLILAQASYQGGVSQYVELIPAGLPTTPVPSTLSLTLIGVMLCWGWWAQGRRPSRTG